MADFLKHRWRLALGVVWAGCVAVLTLQPGAMTPTELASLPSGCIICGARGGADAILNVILFAPLGIALGGRLRDVPVALLAGAAVSVGIELTQASLPGRHAGLADVIWNTAGAGTGALAHALVVHRLRASHGVGGTPWALLAGVVLLCSGLMMGPAPTEGDYWVLMTPELGRMPTYGGAVITASMSGRELIGGRTDGDAVRADLADGAWSLAATITVSSPSRHLSPILVLGDPDPSPTEVLFLGRIRDHLVLRERVLAHALLFDAPDLRFENAFAGLDPGDSVHITAERSATGTCLSVEGRRRCNIGITPSRSWSLLQYLEGPPEWFRRLLDFGWLSALLVPAGFFARSRRDALAAVGVGLAALAGCMLFTPLLLQPVLEALAVVSGVAAGRLVALRSDGQATTA